MAYIGFLSVGLPPIQSFFKKIVKIIQPNLIPFLCCPDSAWHSRLDFCQAQWSSSGGSSGWARLCSALPSAGTGVLTARMALENGKSWSTGPLEGWPLQGVGDYSHPPDPQFCLWDAKVRLQPQYPEWWPRTLWRACTWNVAHGKELELTFLFNFQ